jgi:hypothetical protein
LTPERRQKYFPIALIAKDRFPVVSTIQKMIRGPCKLDASFPGMNAAILSRPLMGHQAKLSRFTD